MLKMNLQLYLGQLLFVVGGAKLSEQSMNKSGCFLSALDTLPVFVKACLNMIL